jgi:hypothetical protein
LRLGLFDQLREALKADGLTQALGLLRQRSRQPTTRSPRVL